MRHSEEAKCFAYLSLLLCRYTILFRELRRAFGRRRLRGRPTTFRRLSVVSSFPRVYLARRTDHIAYLVRLKRSLVLARAVSFVTLLASMTRMHGPMPSETQTHFRTVQFFTFSQLPPLQHGAIKPPRLPRCAFSSTPLLFSSFVAVEAFSTYSFHDSVTSTRRTRIVVDTFKHGVPIILNILILHPSIPTILYHIIPHHITPYLVLYPRQWSSS